MFKKLGNVLGSIKPINSLMNKFGYKRSSEMVSNDNLNIELDILWEDIRDSIPNSNTDSIINNAMKRNGIYGYVTSCLLITEEGREYIPEQLSDHWMGYVCSPKFKPKKIVYHLIK